MFGLSDLDWKFIQDNLITPLQNHGAQVWIFGSRATGSHREFSDLDVLYEKSNELPVGFLSELKEKMEESNLSIKVDIVEVSDLAESYLSNANSQKIAV